VESTFGLSVLVEDMGHTETKARFRSSAREPILRRCFEAVTALVVACAASTAFAGDAPVDAIRTAIDDGAWKKAVSLARTWADDEPDSAAAHFWLALSLRTKIEAVSGPRALLNVPRYRRALDRAIALDPSHIEARQERIGYLIFAPGIAGGNRGRARDEIVALEAIDEAAAAEMRQVLASSEEPENQGVSKGAPPR
jgi:hypothetical protein